jgi:hypothetical protein
MSFLAQGNYAEIYSTGINHVFQGSPMLLFSHTELRRPIQTHTHTHTHFKITKNVVSLYGMLSINLNLILIYRESDLLLMKEKVVMSLKCLKS